MRAIRDFCRRIFLEEGELPPAGDNSGRYVSLVGLSRRHQDWLAIFATQADHVGQCRLEVEVEAQTPDASGMQIVRTQADCFRIARKRIAFDLLLLADEAMMALSHGDRGVVLDGVNRVRVAALNGETLHVDVS